MSQLLSLSRAARLAGVSRGELQARIRDENIETFEGKIAVDDLLAAYPEVDIHSDPVLERIARIKAEARPKSRYTDHWMPEPEVLMARLEDFQHLLTRTKASLNTIEEVLAEVTERLEAAAQGDEHELRADVVEISAHLRRAMTKAQARADRKAELFARDAMLRFIAVSARLLPSGHEFFVEGRDSLLEAALKAGLHLDYGCSSGNCGSCKVRVLDGRVRQIRDHDYVLSAQEREQGYCLACSNTAVTDVLLEAKEALIPADLPHQEIRCVVRKAEVVTEGLGLVHVQTPRTQTLRFMAGQHVRVTLEDGQRRYLAVASCPCDGRNLQFLARRQVGDRFVDLLLAGRKGQTLMIEGPYGRFSLEEESVDPAFFVAVGDGFAPIKSLIEHAIAIDNAVAMHLFRIDAVPHGSLLGNLCRSWHDALDNFAYHRLEPSVGPAEVVERIAGIGGDLAKLRLYVAAPADWLKGFVEDARARGLADETLRSIAVDIEYGRG
jgi:CDP-4-dehydro-6-deoxyglucose reductase